MQLLGMASILSLRLTEYGLQLLFFQLFVISRIFPCSSFSSVGLLWAPPALQQQFCSQASLGTNKFSSANAVQNLFLICQITNHSLFLFPEVTLQFSSPLASAARITHTHTFFSPMGNLLSMKKYAIFPNIHSGINYFKQSVCQQAHMTGWQIALGYFMLSQC